MFDTAGFMPDVWNPVGAGGGLYGEAGGPLGHPTGASADPTGAGMFTMPTNDQLLNTLRGIKAPTAPTVQMPSAVSPTGGPSPGFISAPAPIPNAPALRPPTPIRGGEFLELMMRLNAPQAPRQAPMMPRLSQLLGRG